MLDGLNCTIVREDFIIDGDAGIGDNMIDFSGTCHGGRCAEEVDLIIPVRDVAADEFDACKVVSIYKYAYAWILGLPRQFRCELFSLLSVHVPDTDVHTGRDLISIHSLERDQIFPYPAACRARTYALPRPSAPPVTMAVFPDRSLVSTLTSQLTFFGVYDIVGCA